jgi:outer membrane protein OmpA-like peptidoglycan-associated protein
LGDFPEKWNSNSGGELVTVNGQTGHWLMINKKGRFVPEYIKELPDNFTLQFNLMSNEKFDFYSNGLELFFLTGANDNQIFVDYFMSEQKRSGVKLYFHPVTPGNKSSGAAVEVWEDGKKLMDNDITTPQFDSHIGNNKVNVSIWRQKQRIRVYLNEEKIFDMPRAFPAGKKYTATMFQIRNNMANDKDRFLIGNVKFAVGAPDTRNKLITEGKFITRGILFDVNSDRIRPESYGTLKDIAGVLTENGGVKVKIIGHTDADGSDADNLTLSKQRAESVKASLVKDFNIDETRIQTDGKGESQPVDKNITNEARANNRRVEFVKL